MVILTAQNCRINITNAFTNAELTFVNFHENPRKHIGGPRFRLIRRGTRDAGLFFAPPPLRPLNITTSEASDPGDGWGARSRQIENNLTDKLHRLSQANTNYFSNNIRSHSPPDVRFEDTFLELGGVKEKQKCAI